MDTHMNVLMTKMAIGKYLEMPLDAPERVNFTKMVNQMPTLKRSIIEYANSAPEDSNVSFFFSGRLSDIDDHVYSKESMKYAIENKLMVDESSRLTDWTTSLCYFSTINCAVYTPTHMSPTIRKMSQLGEPKNRVIREALLNDRTLDLSNLEDLREVMIEPVSRLTLWEKVILHPDIVLDVFEVDSREHRNIPDWEYYMDGYMTDESPSGSWPVWSEHKHLFRKIINLNSDDIRDLTDFHMLTEVQDVLYNETIYPPTLEVYSIMKSAHRTSTSDYVKPEDREFDFSGCPNLRSVSIDGKKISPDCTSVKLKYHPDSPFARS